MLLRNVLSTLTIAPIRARHIGLTPRLQGTNVPVEVALIRPILHWDHRACRRRSKPAITAA